MRKEDYFLGFLGKEDYLGGLLFKLLGWERRRVAQFWGTRTLTSFKGNSKKEGLDYLGG